MPQFRIGEVILNGKYRIEELLGEGAFGEVYLATHLNLKALRALKVLRKEGESGVGSTLYGNARRRFLQESELGAMLGNHPHIIQVMDFDEVEDLMVLALEYAPGGSLADKLELGRQKDSPMEIGEAVRIAAEVAEGLAVLHNPRRNIVHRDIKPNNILFDAGNHAKVADLGLAQVPHGASMRSRFSQPEHHPGTPVYMSPEQENTFDYLGFTSDIYSLGVVLFEMLTLSPYSTRTLRPGTRLKTLRPQAPAWLDELVMRMLSKDAQERPFDGDEAAKELRQTERPPTKVNEVVPGIVHLPAIESEKVETSQEPQGTQGAQARDALETAIKYQEWEDAEGLLKQYEALVPCSPLVQIYRKQVDRGMEPILAARKVALEKAKQEAAERERKAAEEKAKQVAEEQARHKGLWVNLAHGVEMEFVRVPAGVFKMGSNESGEEKPIHEVHLDEYWMGRYPVTNGQYSVFVKTSGHSSPSHWGKSGVIPGGLENHPVVNVSWKDAVAFCDWLSKETGQKIALPTEAQWEKAARGIDGLTYPWGNETPNPMRCNFNNQVKSTTPVGQYSPLGDSPYDCVDMAGNVWEWCADWYDRNYYSKSPPSNPAGPSIGQHRVLHGGSWFDGSGHVRSAYRYGNRPDDRDDSQGFRCARSLP